MPRSQQPLSETRQLAVLRSCSAVFRVIYSREMARFLVYILEREPHYFVHPVICPLVVCPDPSTTPPPLIPRRIPALSRNGSPRRPVTRRRLNPLLLKPARSFPWPSLINPLFENRSCTGRLSRPIVKSRASFQSPRPPLRFSVAPLCVENCPQLIRSFLGEKRRFEGYWGYVSSKNLCIDRVYRDWVLRVNDRCESVINF